MDKRRGPSISVKMIATTTLLILVIVALFGALHVLHTGSVFDEQALRQSESFRSALKKRGDAQTRDLVHASESAIGTHDWSTLQTFVPNIGKDDPEVAWVYVVDKDGIVNAASDREMNGRPITDPVVKTLIANQGPASKETEGHYIFSRPVEEQGVRLGSVVLA